jgi:hypothetical protein
MPADQVSSSASRQPNLATWLGIRSLCPEGTLVRCLTDGPSILAPRAIGEHLRVGDQVCGPPATTPPASELLARRIAPGYNAMQIYLCRIGYVTQPKTDRREQHFVRAEVVESSLGISSLHLPNSAVRDYFYFFTRRPGEERGTILYELLRTLRTAAFADLRLCYRVRRLELAAQEPLARMELRSVERAFNLLSHPELRSCYDALLLDPDAPVLFPYGGFGQCLVSGHLSDDGETFFVRRILAYLPDQAQRSFRAPLRRVEYYDGYAVYRDGRRKAEVYIDPSLLPLGWDATWNQWRHLVGTKIGVSAAFVGSGKYHRRRGEWHLVNWQTAVPSRLSVTIPPDAAAVMNAARRAYERFGEYYDPIERIRMRLEHEPIEERDLSDLCRQLRIPSEFDVAQFCWKPDYDPVFYKELKKRSIKVFLFRKEYIFVTGRAVVAEIPQLGHATYVFAKPTDIHDFVHRYAATTREDIRNNRGNVASELGFIGRVMHGNNPRGWLKDLKVRIGETADYTVVAAVP